MKEYTILEIKCDKSLTFSEIHSIIDGKVKHNRNLFSIMGLQPERMTKDNLALFESLEMDRFAYKFTLEHRVGKPDYNPQIDDRHLFSNLDENWKWHNPQVNDSVSDEFMERLTAFLDKVNANAMSTQVVVFDEIEWGGTPVGKGAYGYRKADATYLWPMNYLSNAVVVGRTYQSKTCSAYISCETIFRKLPVVQELAESLGKIKKEFTYYAPEDDAERELWDKEKAEAEAKFKSAVAGFENLRLEDHVKIGTAGTSRKIDVKKYIKTYLCTDGWKIEKPLPEDWSLVVRKRKGDASIGIGIDSRHNGHALQMIVCYKSRSFLFSEHVEYISDAHEDQIEICIRNGQKIRDYFYEVL